MTEFILTPQDITDRLNNEGRYTIRKKINSVKIWVKDLEYIIDHITPRIHDNDLAWYLGDQYFKKDLQAFQDELSAYKDYLNLLTAKP